ncbi:MAG TPA: 50S ribosomal protein L21 [Tenericutes bacterium]|jgi:large subunit ribosomal protein L21|nr:50S ribosomal protein L21 [Mycoplasmatota bacterium]
MYAIIETGGKQYQVEEGSTIYVEKLPQEVGEKVVFDKVLMISGDKNIVGTPYVKDAKVEGTIEKHGKQRKIVIFKYVPKNSSHKKQGHRQPYTKVKINKIIMK